MVVTFRTRARVASIIRQWDHPADRVASNWYLEGPLDSYSLTECPLCPVHRDGGRGGGHRRSFIWRNMVTDHRRNLGEQCGETLRSLSVRAELHADEAPDDDDYRDDEAPEARELDSDAEWEPELDVKAPEAFHDDDDRPHVVAPIILEAMEAQRRHREAKVPDDQDAKWRDLPTNLSMASSSWDVKRLICHTGNNVFVQWWPSGVTERQVLEAQELWGHQIVNIDQRGSRYVITWADQVIPAADYEAEDEL